jgi:2-dehydropantoate 2-reductase
VQDVADVVILGAGAMGCLFGARLARGGHRVVLVDVRPDQIDAINTGGLTLEADDGTATVHPRACRPEEARDVARLVIVFTKAFHSAAALAAARAVLGPDTWVLSLQNGLGHVEVMRAHVDEPRIVVGTTTFPADLVGPGRVRTHGAGQIKIMSVAGGVSERLRELAAAFNACGLDTAIEPEVFVSIWEKLAFNCAMNALAAVTGLTVGGMGSAAEGRAIADRVVGEVIAVARRKGIPAELARVRDVVAMAFREHGDHKPSMLQDLLAGRPTEIDFINGAVVREARALGMSVPTTETLGDLVRLRERRN